jgi:hypothetical protein
VNVNGGRDVGISASLNLGASLETVHLAGQPSTQNLYHLNGISVFWVLSGGLAALNWVDTKPV